MHDPRPVLVILLLGAVGLLALGGWWSTLPVETRWQHLNAIASTEHLRTRPPIGLWEQGQWLVQHRVVHLQGMVGLWILCVVIGVSEGWWRRSQDILGGFRMTRWTCGVLLAPLTLVSCAAYLMLPWPIQPWWMAYGGGALVMTMGWCVGGGRPYVP